jgi:hypothetical protein
MCLREFSACGSHFLEIRVGEALAKGVSYDVVQLVCASTRAREVLHIKQCTRRMLIRLM